ncbi:Protein CBG11600 [Caenorhabditis briggsae]|uniref:Protein CBG11600 n=1 Tax=Caenorhabditis briggsae TaxID=6238 RepID=A8XDL5_CAEBR|nr:Protein CBG11600 [Caenorhabditis briggsae]CAP30734.1 Protein CBG11600 [Caenorhabditis briggsae]
MTTNAMLRMRSKSISDVFATSEWDEDKEDLIPRQKQDNTLKSTLDKWKRSLNLNPRTNDQQPFDRRTSRANSFFSRPPLKMWENRRASLSSLKTQIKDRITGKSNENLATSRDGNTFQRQQRSRYEEEED